MASGPAGVPLPAGPSTSASPLDSCGCFAELAQSEPQTIMAKSSPNSSANLGSVSTAPRKGRRSFNLCA